MIRAIAAVVHALELTCPFTDVSADTSERRLPNSTEQTGFHRRVGRHVGNCIRITASHTIRFQRLGVTIDRPRLIRCALDRAGSTRRGGHLDQEHRVRRHHGAGWLCVVRLRGRRRGRGHRRAGAGRLHALISPGNKVDAHTVSIATNDGAFANPWLSDIAAGYEQLGKSRWAYSNNEGATWTIPAQAWTLPPGTASDGSAFSFYEGSSTVIGYHRNQTGTDPFARNFVYVNKIGSTAHGSSLGNGTQSTDVAVLVSDDGAASFTNPIKLTQLPGGYIRLEIDYVTSASYKNIDGLDDNIIAVIWRETRIPSSGSSVARWMRQDVAVASVPGTANDTLVLVGGLTELSGIPSTIQGVTAVMGYGVSEGGAGSGDICVGWGLPNTVSSCPSTSTQNMQWRVNCQPINTTYEELVATDASWRRCVGASSVVGGTAFNKNSSRPALALNPVTKKVYIGMAKKRTFQRHILACRGVEETSAQFLGS